MCLRYAMHTQLAIPAEADAVAETLTYLCKLHL